MTEIITLTQSDKPLTHGTGQLTGNHPLTGNDSLTDNHSLTGNHIMQHTTSSAQLEIAGIDGKNDSPLSQNGQRPLLEFNISNDAPISSSVNDSPDLKSKISYNCFLLMSSGKLFLEKESACKGGVSAVFLPEGWAYAKREDAEIVAARFSEGKRKVSVIPWYNSLINELWYGTKEEAKLAKKKITLEINQNKNNEKVRKIESDCGASGLSPSWLHREILPDDMSDKEKLVFEKYKPLWNAARDEKADAELQRHDINLTEEDLKESLSKSDHKYGDYTVSSKGVYFSPEGSDPLRICSPIWPEAYLRDIEGKSHTLLIKINDGEKDHKIALPRKVILKWAELTEILLDIGQIVPNIPVNQKHLQNFLMEAKPSKLMRCVNKSGWHGEQYIFPDGEIIGAAKDSEGVHPLSRDIPKGLGKKGSHEDWLKHVWALCANNSRPIFSVGVALASPCMYLTGEDSGGFNFVGNSSIGKSRCLEIAISVFGSPDFKRSWKNTSNGFEALCSLHNDLLLPMDEGGQADPKELGENIYMFSQGMGKGRMYKDTSARDSKDWRAMLLSTSEAKLNDLMREGKKKPKPGQLVRVVDIPAEVKGAFGCFEELHGFENGVDGARFADKIREVCRQYYGTVGKEFICALIKYGIDNVKEDLKNISDDFSADVARNFDGQVKRVADRFGLVFAALSLAIKLDVLKGDITIEMAKNAVKTCFSDWLGNRGTTGNMETFNLVRQVEGLLLENSDGKFIDISEYRKDEKLRNAIWGCKDGHKFYVLCHAFTEHLCEGVDSNEAITTLIKAGILDPSLAGNQKKINGVNTRCYLINLNAPKVM